MKKIFLLTLMAFVAINVTAQKKVCDSPSESEEDLNSISVTKCTIKDSKDKANKKSRQITVKVSAKKRYLVKRERLKKQAVSGVASIETSGLAVTEQKAAPTKSLTFKNNISDITKKLSREELKKASKFSTVDRLPQFNECKKVKKGEQSDCFNQEMVKHISKHFRYPSQAIKESIQGEVWVRFIIDKNGDIRNVKTLGPKNGVLLNEEAIRVVSKLPQFAPAKKDGGSVSVKYGFPIAFSLEE